MEQIGINVLAGLIIAILTAWITVQLSLKQFQSQKVWELKLEAYTNIIHTLYHLKEPCEKDLREVVEEISIPHDEKANSIKKSRQAQMDLDKVINTGTLLFSNEALRILRDFKREYYSLDEDSAGWLKVLEQTIEITNKCITEFIAQSKVDLKIK